MGLLTIKKEKRRGDFIIVYKFTGYVKDIDKRDLIQKEAMEAGYIRVNTKNEEKKVTE